MRQLLRIAVVLLFAAWTGQAAAELRLMGASTLLPVAREAAEQWRRDGGGAIEVRGGGSDAAIHEVNAGVVDIALVSRALTAEEARSVTATSLALDGLALIVNERNPLTTITHEQVRGLFSGRIAQWSELGAPAALGATIPVVKSPRQAARQTFDEHFGIAPLLPPRSIELGSNLAILLYVSSDPQAVGYVSSGALAAAQRRGLRVRGLALDGAAPGALGCVEQHYPLCRPLLLVTKGAPRNAAKRFIEFLASPAGRAIVAHHGFAETAAEASR